MTRLLSIACAMSFALEFSGCISPSQKSEAIKAASTLQADVVTVAADNAKLQALAPVLPPQAQQYESYLDGVISGAQVGTEALSGIVGALPVKSGT